MPQQILPEDLNEKIKAQENFVLLDCREQDEHDYTKIEGSILIPLSEFQERAVKELNPDDVIVIYCHHGMRSWQACLYLEGHGFKNVINLAGGIEQWSISVDPKIKRY